jgi:hypothetical protein
MTLAGNPHRRQQRHAPWDSLTPLQKILDIVIILLATCFFALPFLTNAVGEQSDTACKPNWDYSVPCTNGQEKEVDGKEVIGGQGCFCEDTTNGHTTDGKCVSADKCEATNPAGTPPSTPDESGVPPQNPQPNTDTSPSAGTTPDMGTIPETPEEQAAQSLENYGNAVAGATPPANSGEAPGSPPTYDEVTGWDTSPPSPTDMNIDPGMPTTPMSCTSADCVYNETTGQYEQPPSPPPNYPTTEVPPHSSYSLPPEYQPLESETVLPGGITRGELYDTPMSEMSPEGEPAAPSESSTHEPTINPNGTFSEQPAPTPAAPASPSFFSDPLGAVSNWVGSAWSYVKSFF